MMSIRRRVLQFGLGIAATGLLTATSQAQQGLEGVIRLSLEPAVEAQPQTPAQTASSVRSLNAPRSLDDSGRYAARPTFAQPLVATQQTGSRPKPQLPAAVLDSKVRVADTSMDGRGLIPADGQLPNMQVSGLPDGIQRGATLHCVHWAPSAICHFPLYFEDAMLERHGQSRFGCAQPLVSGAKFISTLPLLPYLTTLQPPCKSRYALGHYRPGTCAPVLRDSLPYDARAAAVEIGALAGLFWAAPL